MATTEELLAQLEAEAQSETPVCIIDPDTRTITVPPEYQLFGVENDKRVERLYFQCPKIVGDNQDLSQGYQLFINYQNANGDLDAYHIDDMEIDGDNITFSWLLEENVTKYRGNIQFAFGAIKPGDEAEDPDKNRWNTTINADCTCLVGLKSTQQVAESNPDALAQIWAAIDELKAGGGGGGTTNYNDLNNLPTMNDKEIKGALTGEDVGLVDKNQGEENAGKVLGIGTDGTVTPMDPQGNIEQMIENYYAMRRTGKVYQTKIWKFASNPTSVGEKMLDNAGLVFEPSTDTEEGRDDYLSGQHPLFEWCNVNYIRDADGSPRPTYIEGMEGYKTSGSVDVGAMQMSFYWNWDTSNAEYDLVTISDTPHPELGLKPWPECVRADGTVMPWCIGSKYISGIASDGNLRSQPGLKPERKQSHNNMITNYQAKGEGYWGAGAVRNTFQIIFNIIKGATKSSQSLYAGCTSYSFQYEAAVQSEEAHTYFPVTNAQANSIVVGGYVSVGYGYSTGSTISNDRSYDSVHAYVDSVKVLSIEDLDENNKAVYLDVQEEDAFDTMPHVYSESLSAPVILTSIHWRSGATDEVRGKHDGSPGSNTNGKYPYRVQGREYAVGGYIVASDTMTWQNESGTRTVYSAKKGTEHSSVTNTIQSTYKEAGTIPVNSSGSVGDYWIGDVGVDFDTGASYPRAQGSGSSQGVGDCYYAGGTGTNTFREYLQGGNLGYGASAGASILYSGGALGDASWDSLACD